MFRGGFMTRDGPAEGDRNIIGHPPQAATRLSGGTQFGSLMFADISGNGIDQRAEASRPAFAAWSMPAQLQEGD
jgi:hypothetical protein